MSAKMIFDKCFELMKKNNIPEGECTFIKEDLYEYNVHGGEVSLLRTTKDINLKITIIKDSKKGTVSLNKVDDAALEQALKNVIAICQSSPEDESYAIAPKQEDLSFSDGPLKPNLEEMYDSVEKFCHDVKTMYPLYKYEEGILKFIHEERTYANTNGTFLESNRSYYENTIMGSAKDENTTTSFNYSMQTSSNLDEDLIDQGGMKTVIESSVNELQAKPLEGKFVGDILITPLTVVDFLGSYSAVFLSDPAILSGSSRLIDSLDQKVASDKLTVKSLVNDKRLAAPMMITPDGFIAKDMVVFDKGVLKNFSISYYTELKTGFKRALNRGNIEVLAGDVKLEDMIKNTKEGIIVGRFSGGSPSSNGDFSGVAKNSYYVKDGEIQYPITETMISGNLYDLFNDIVDISEERVNYGLFITPTIRCNNVTISGK